MISDGSTQFIVRVISSQAYVDTLTNAIQSKISDLIMVKQWTVDWPSSQSSLLSVTANDYDGYKFVCWINFTSNGTIIPLYTNWSVGKTVSVFSYDSNGIKGNKVDCIAMYIKI